MKRIIGTTLFFYFLLIATGYSQIESGFKPLEGKQMIQLCNSFSYLDLYNDDQNIIPPAYKKVYTSPSYGMDNKFQVFTSGENAAINFRGTTPKQLSWMENLFASMIPAKGKIIVNGDRFSYQLGKSKTSHIHAGYTLSIYYLKDDLLKQIKKLNKKGIYNIYLTGHSQGGALAQLVRAYFDYLPNNVLSKKNRFKVYAIASPMVGDKSFVQEYNQNYSKPGMSYLINSANDFVTKLPFSYNDSTFWKENFTKLLTNRDGFSTQSMLFQGVSLLFKGEIIAVAKNMSKNIEKQIFNDFFKYISPFASNKRLTYYFNISVA